MHKANKQAAMRSTGTTEPTTAPMMVAVGAVLLAIEGEGTTSLFGEANKGKRRN